jgi:hypothetical protein
MKVLFPMQIVTGNVVTGDNFYKGRRPAVDHLREKLKTSDVLIVGPRRTGKTSVIREYLLQEEENNPEFKSIFINLESTQNLYDFYFKIIREIFRATRQWRVVADRAGELIRTTVNRLGEVFEGKIDVATILGLPSETQITINIPRIEPKKIGEMIKQLEEILKNLPIDLVIALDEFPELIWKLGRDLPTVAAQRDARVEQTSLMLAGLRTLRQQSNVEARKHKIIIAGSVNLRNTLSYLGLEPQINDMEQVEISDLLPKQCIELFEELIEAEALKFTPERNYESFIGRQFGSTSPFYIQSFAQLLVQLRIDRAEDKPFTDEDLKSCYKKLISSGAGPRFLINRIEKYYNQAEHKYVYALLKAVAKVQFENRTHISEEECFAFVESETKEKLERMKQTDLLAKLNADNLIDVDSVGLYFTSQFLCNFWHYSLIGTEYLV